MTSNEMEQSDRQGGERAPPVWKVSAGGVQVAVWRNPAPRGGFFHTVTLDRRYRRRDGQWDSSATLRMNDVPKAILALQKAYERIVSAGDGGQDDEGEAPSSSAQASATMRQQAPVAELMAAIRPDLLTQAGTEPPQGKLVRG